uniref:Uncharacterized protein n=1 Tax=Cucumis sativus TaxID=3659 RepID=A0A0A0KGS1_CUCSA
MKQHPRSVNNNRSMVDLREIGLSLSYQQNNIMTMLQESEINAHPIQLKNVIGLSLTTTRRPSSFY